MNEINILKEKLSREVTQLVLSVQIEKKIDNRVFERLSNILKEITVSLKDVEYVSKSMLLDIHVATNALINEYPYLDSINLKESESVVSELQKYFYLILNNERYDERVSGVPRIF